MPKLRPLTFQLFLARAIKMAKTQKSANPLQLALSDPPFSRYGSSLCN